MELKFYFLFLPLLLNLIKELDAHGGHPHGSAKFLVHIERKGNSAEFHGNKELIDNTFMHPQVKDRKIVVFSIIGAYRQGKSFFLDYCLRYLYATYGSINTNGTNVAFENWLGDRNQPLSGFSWKHGSKADTKGLKMWSDVFLYDAPDGEKIAIVVIDTQGLFEKNSNEEENAKIFSFSTLVSSIQVVNIKERIQEDQIAHLQTAIELTNLITMKQKNHGYSKKKAFQKLIFLLRDFEDEDYEFGYEGGKKYFEDYFKNDAEETPLNEISKKTEVNRKSIQDSFDEISCFLLNYPGEVIRNANFNGEWGKLKKKFVENLKIFIESLFAPKNLVRKSFLGNEMTGEKYKDILIALTESYGTFDLPQVDSIYQIAIDNQMSAIVKENVKNYKAAMTNETNDYDRRDFAVWLQRKHNVNKAVAIDEFLKAEKIEDKPSEKKFQKILEDEIEEFFKPFEKSTLETYKAIKTDREMQEILNKKLKNYEMTIGKDVNYEVENFEESIESKHQSLKNNSILEFLDATKIYNDASRSEKLKLKLEQEIQKIFETWKETALVRRQEIQIRNFSNSALETYRQKINSENNFDQSDFESKFNLTHWDMKTEAIAEFLKSTRNKFDSEIVEQKIKALGDEIDALFITLRPSKLALYKAYKERNNLEVDAYLDQLVVLQLEAFENDFTSNVTYGIESFEEETLNRFYRSKNFAIDGFTAATNKSEYLIKKVPRFSNLTKEIQESFDKWNATAYLENEKKLQINKIEKQNKIKDLADRKFTEFIKEISQVNYDDENFAKDSFETDLKNDFETFKYETVNSFRTEANIFNDTATSVDRARDLTDKIDSYYNNWKADIWKQKIVYDERENALDDKKIRIIVDEKYSQYKNEMEAKVKYILDQQKLHTTHTVAKNSAVSSFNKATINFKNLTSVEHFKATLEKEINDTYHKFKIFDVFNDSKLRTTGLWVPWQGSRNDFPPNAVIGGYYDKGGCAVARYHGKLGQWCVKKSTADINGIAGNGDSTTILKASEFELLLHTNWKYVKNSKVDRYTPIMSDGEMMCKVNIKNGDKYLGRATEENGCSYVSYGGNEPDDDEYEVLVLN